MKSYGVIALGSLLLFASSIGVEAARRYVVGQSGDIRPGVVSSLNLASTAVTPGTYTLATLTVNAAGQLTAASSGTAAVTSVTGTAPIVSSGGATPAISIPVATGAANGYLSSTDWTTFNNKVGGGPYLALTGGTLTGGISNSTSGNGALLFTATPTAATTASVVTLGAALSGGNTNGTWLGGNLPNAGPDILNFQIVGTSELKVDGTGLVTAAKGYSFGGGTPPLITSGSGAPAGGCSDGSLYLRSVSPNGSLYVCNTSAWTGPLTVP